MQPEHKHPPLYLIGLRGCGKSTLGQQLAQCLGWHFVDTDAYIQEKAGCSIAQMVEKQGWDFFREAESVALQAVSQENCVVATGGGIVLRAENRSFMQTHGQVVFLAVSPQLLCSRLQKTPLEGQRPALTTLSPLQEMEKMLQERLPFYTSTAQHTLDGSKSVKTLLKEIMTLVTKHPCSSF